MSENKKMVTLIMAGVAFSLAIGSFLEIVEVNNYITGLLWFLVGYNNVNEVKRK